MTFFSKIKANIQRRLQIVSNSHVFEFVARHEKLLQNVRFHQQQLYE